MKRLEDLKIELGDPNKLLTHYDPAETVVSSDASSYGLGTVVTQLQQNGIVASNSIQFKIYVRQINNTRRLTRKRLQLHGCVRDSAIF